MAAPTTGFWYALADVAGNMVTGTEVRLSPAPASVEYPTEFMGSMQTTAEGNQITQQPLKDSRLRHWVWRGFPVTNVNYRKLWAHLVDLRAKTRFKRGQSPYVYLIDCESGTFVRRVDTSFSVASSTSTTVTLTGAALTTDIAKTGTVEVASGLGQYQVRTISSNTTNVITISDAWTTLPTSAGSSVVRLSYEYAEWVKCRVIDVSRRVVTGTGVINYEDARISFIPDDVNFNQF